MGGRQGNYSCLGGHHGHVHRLGNRRAMGHCANSWRCERAPCSSTRLVAPEGMATECAAEELPLRADPSSRAVEFEVVPHLRARSVQPCVQHAARAT